MTNTIEDLSIPKAIVNRILKGAPAGQVSMSKEAREAFVKSVTVFISFISAQAADLARKSGRKTIAANDVYEALNTSEFEDFTEAIKRDTSAFQQDQREKRSIQTKNARASKKAAAVATISSNTAQNDDMDMDQDEEEPQSKKLKEGGDEEDA
ncbi:UNVERIFIED_CONTAM: DNA polymerase epsilon subunit 3 [Siphonaria sp. JEL0065]|nr:DNA polymerase epsilon subunit 3 [Siphonaria sp. JEL0065]